MRERGGLILASGNNFHRLRMPLRAKKTQLGSLRHGEVGGPELLGVIGSTNPPSETLKPALVKKTVQTRHRIGRESTESWPDGREASKGNISAMRRPWRRLECQDECFLSPIVSPIDLLVPWLPVGGRHPAHRNSTTRSTCHAKGISGVTWIDGKSNLTGIQAPRTIVSSRCPYNR